jgi:NAD(P)-dependent dehydrogenase (short-subunit alcohol dehydrogenase family)
MTKNIVITGASSGIGKTLYECFKEDISWRCSRNRYISKQQVIGISRHGPDIILDLSQDFSAREPLVKDVYVLINCAGIMPLEEIVPEAIMNINFWGTYRMIYNLQYRENACIINIASVSGIRPDADTPVYCATKAAIIALTKSLALKFAPDIRVNCISPGFYKTNLVPGVTPKELISKVPLGYQDNPMNLYTMVKAIIDTPYMTGANIVVDGGVSL